MTLRQAAWTLMFVVLYVGAVAGVIVALGATGIIDFTLGTLLPVLLTSITAAPLLALYLHLFRRNNFTSADLGFRRLTPRLFHLLWQIPASIIVCALVQGLSFALLALTEFGAATTEAAADPLLDDIADLPALVVVIAVLCLAVFTPVWEETLFRGAFLDGFSRRFRPAAAIVLSAGLFAALHILPLSLPYLFSLGIALALLRRFHDNLWAPILLHAANNAFVVLIALSIT